LGHANISVTESYMDTSIPM